MNKVKNFILRNKRKINESYIESNKVNLEWWNLTENLGDTLAEVIYSYMIQKNGVDRDKYIKSAKHLMTVGSIIGMRNFDATIWGSGIHTFGSVRVIMKHRWYVKYDIRSVRGPVTGEILRAAGYACPEIYGDPAILMPMIYNPENKIKKYKVSVIYHMSQMNEKKDERFHYINIQTSDYKQFIDEIVESELVISSSLHGIILAETYGVPAVFLSGKMKNEMMKFLDWYYSTGRYSVVMAQTMEAALKVKPMLLPELTQMQKQLLDTFPTDLWD